MNLLDIYFWVLLTAFVITTLLAIFYPDSE
jgi:hypothetical protein